MNLTRLETFVMSHELFKECRTSKHGHLTVIALRDGRSVLATTREAAFEAAENELLNHTQPAATAQGAP